MSSLSVRQKPLFCVPVDRKAEPCTFFCPCYLVAYQMLTLSCFLLWFTERIFIIFSPKYFIFLKDFSQKTGSGNIPSVINLFYYIVSLLIWFVTYMTFDLECKEVWLDYLKCWLQHFHNVPKWYRKASNFQCIYFQIWWRMRKSNCNRTCLGESKKKIAF